MNKICLIILTWITFLSTASATGQEGERIIWKGQKYEMLTLPLFQCHEFDSLGRKFEDEWSMTSLWRGYQGHWCIENDMLYLDYIVPDSGEKLYAKDIPALRKYCKNGRVAATWFSDTLRVVSGKKVLFEPMGFTRYYEHEDFIAVKQGKVVSVKRVENKLLIKGKMDDQRELVKFIDDLGKQLHKRYPKESGRILAQIKYCNFGLMMMPSDVEVTFPSDENAPHNKAVEKEIKEKLANYILANQFLPCYYINGKIKSPSWTFPIRLEPSK
jgi:hypothetical protein